MASLRLMTRLLLCCLAIPPTLSVSSRDSDRPHKEAKYRISPIDGSVIALPTREQLAFQEGEIGALIHFDVATWLDIDGCNSDPSLVPDVSLFDPRLINTNQWLDSIASLGAKHATLVVKHNCGFASWPSKVTFPTRESNRTTIDYNYTTVQSPLHGLDVAGSFADSARKYHVGHGFYYSVVVNNFLNVQKSRVRTGRLSSGQVGITDDVYDRIVLDQLSELWSNYGSLTEIWFDGGVSVAQRDAIQKLLRSKQPQAVVFNGCDDNGSCVTDHPVRWIGNEMGSAPEENWSTGLLRAGDPTSPYFVPSECDTTLQTNGRWFFGVGQPLRSLREMVDVYHATVGRNCLLELDFSPDRSGLIPADHAARYKQLGDFIRSCYDEPIGHNKGRNETEGAYHLTFDYPASIDRIQLMEDQSNGQVIRSYKVFAKIVDVGRVNGTLDVPWTLVSKGTSVGHKKIDLFDKSITVTEVLVTPFADDTRPGSSGSTEIKITLPNNSRRPSRWPKFPAMQVTVLVGIALGAAVVVMLINTVQTRLRHRAMAKKLGCKPPVAAPSTEPSGIVATYRSAKASKEKRFPQFLQEQLEKLNAREGRQVGTLTFVTPLFKRMIFTVDPQNIQAMLALKFTDFGLGVNRTDNFRPLLGNGIFAANGKQWEHSRALLRPQFVRSQVSDLDLEEAHVRNLMTVLEHHLGSDDGWTGTVDLQVLFFRLTLDSATEFLFGESVNSQLDLQTNITNSSGKDDDSFAYAFDRSQYILAVAARLGNNYWLMHTPELHRMIDRVHRFVDYFVQKAMSNPGEKHKSGHYVFLHALAEQTQDRAELRSQLLNILLAGRDTTASLLGWFFHTLADSRYEHIYKKLRRVVVDEFGAYDNPRDITFERMKSCQYLQWCINEALRLYPVVPMNVRTALTDTTLPTGGGDHGLSPVFVPKGTDVAYSVFIMHRRKDLWGEDCDAFKPERWESRKPGWDYLPFNGGPRICIGQQFALTEIAYVLIRMLQRVDVLDGSGAGPVKHGLTLTNCPADGVKLRLHFADKGM
ncbi:hypothetical protein ED733_003751 [Metarhizium rileyi]|uniref:alpha-L-fucosidase n=1 Tax=Metarhizium rileyi (strain RCEF 4871) TaxID=1649241 RepID=A0A5C6G482_METRR|nr:hypothetical protein ED733_003751 [Metarhizium rileyi]